MAEVTVGIVIIGNEILSGKVADTNSGFLARELRGVGVELRRITVVPDEIDQIVEVICDFRERFDVVITSGGIGPTHDDITVVAVAQALGRRVICHPEIEQGLRRFFKEQVNSAHLKMAQVPEGAELIQGGELRFPVVKVENVYLLPGIPQILEEKFYVIKPRFSGKPYHLREIYSSKGESAIAACLEATLKKFPGLLLGSYPNISDPEYRVKLTLESRDLAYVEEALAHLVGILPEGAVVRTG